MNMQVRSIERIARTHFEREFSGFDHREPLIVTGIFPEVRVFYVCTKTSNSDDRTFVDCRFHFQSRQMWIRSIQVAARQRYRGVGLQLVRAAEATANAMGIEEIRLLPILSAVDFWLKVGYAPDPNVSRVLWKNLPNVASANQ